MKPNCSKHIVPEYLKDHEQVAIDLCNMPYNVLAEHFHHMKNKLCIDSENDSAGERYRLANDLEDLAKLMRESEDLTKEIWKICEPYMKNK